MDRRGLVVAVLAVLLAHGGRAGAAPGWTKADSMHGPRQGHTATLLQDGRVLVTGGSGTQTTVLKTAEIYDPGSDSWASLHDMSVPREGHTATLLDDGRVLVAGGGAGSTAAPTAEIYDPMTNAWSQAAPMNHARSGHAAARLPDGSVIVAGGEPTRSAEIYVPGSNTWKPAAPMHEVREYAAAAQLADLSLLVTGGAADPSAEVYDPVHGAWSLTSPMQNNRTLHTATLLADGRVLVVGGFPTTDSGVPFPAAETWTPPKGAWTLDASLITPRWSHTATRLPGGHVLVAGGAQDLVTEAMALAKTEIYAPDAHHFVQGPSLAHPRAQHTATLLDDGRVLVAGGRDDMDVTGTAEIFAQVAAGEGCAAASDCPSGSCVNSVCCASACDDGLCSTCEPVTGACVPVVMCWPLRCNPGTGMCLDRCRSIDDCAAGLVCDPDGRCAGSPPRSGHEDLGCALPAAPRGPLPPAAPLAFVLAALAARRRARPRRGGLTGTSACRRDRRRAGRTPRCRT